MRCVVIEIRLPRLSAAVQRQGLVVQVIRDSDITIAELSRGRQLLYHDAHEVKNCYYQICRVLIRPKV